MPSSDNATNTIHPNVKYPNAGLLKRFAAMIYDFFLLFAISMTYAAVVLAVKVQLLGFTLAPGEKAQMGMVGFIGWVIILITFYCYFWRRFGQTLGMKAWRLELVNAHGNYASLLQCIMRCIIATVSFALLGIGYWWLLLDSQKITLHDRLTKTRVIQLTKEKKR